MPIGLVEDSDLAQMSAITFSEFNTICPIIGFEEENGELHQRFAGCIEQIKRGFQYPHYYNGLMARLLLFRNDESYHLRDPIRINLIFQDTKELAITGYEDFDNFGFDSLDTLISILDEMSGIFTKVYGNNRTSFGFDNTPTKHDVDACYQEIDGFKTQIKPINYSKNISTQETLYGLVELYHQIPMKETMDCRQRIKCTFEAFENEFASVTSGFVLTTIIGMSNPRLLEQVMYKRIYNYFVVWLISVIQFS